MNYQKFPIKCVQWDSSKRIQERMQFFSINWSLWFRTLTTNWTTTRRVWRSLWITWHSCRRSSLTCLLWRRSSESSPDSSPSSRTSKYPSMPKTRLSSRLWVQVSRVWRWAALRICLLIFWIHRFCCWTMILLHLVVCERQLAGQFSDKK